MQETELKKMRQDVDDLMRWRQGILDNITELQAEIKNSQISSLRQAMDALTEEDIAVEMAKAKFRERDEAADHDQIRKTIAEFKRKVFPTAKEIEDYRAELQMHKVFGRWKSQDET